MKNLKNTLLASSILIALAGCDDKDFKVPVENTTNANAPSQVVDLIEDVNEYLFDEETGEYNLTGTQTFSLLGGAVDLDGDNLLVKNIYATFTDNINSNLDPDDATGFSIANNSQLIVQPLALSADLDLGQVRTAVITFDITDGLNNVPRMMTINIHGRDFKPEAEDPLLAVYTRSASDVERIDLSEGVIDLDGEELTYHSLAIVGDHTSDLPVTLSGNELVVTDVTSLLESIETGGFEEFKFTYKISDHLYTITRELSVGFLGVDMVPGAPVFTEYFLESNVTENNNPVNVDLIQDATDEEGDAISIKNFEVAGGGDLPEGFTLSGNELIYAPAYWGDDLAPSDVAEFNFLFEVEDANGNTSDGQRRLSVKINGEDNNLLIANGFNAGFEDPDSVGLVNDANNSGFVFGGQNWSCSLKEIRASAARTGDYGFRFEGDFCANRISSTFFIPELMEDDRYVMSYWLRAESTSQPSGNPYVPIYAGPELVGTLFWDGPRFDNYDLNVWQEHVQIINPSSGDQYAPFVGEGLWFGLLRYAGEGQHDIDDLNLTRISAFTHPSLDVLSDNSGTFEAGEVITSSGGVTEIRDVAGENKLYVDTTGETSVTVSLPVDASELREDIRYVIAFDIENVNSDDNSAYSVDITNGTESISTSGTAADGSVELIIWEAAARTASVDWSAETMTFDITFTQTDSVFHVDNVRLYTLP